MITDQLVIDEYFSNNTRLLKQLTIASSGVYKYLRREVVRFKGLGGEIPSIHDGRTVFNVYRKAEVLENRKDLFSRQPMTLNHPPEKVTGDNFKKYAVGFSGDSSDLVLVKDGAKVAIKTTAMLIDSEAVNAYSNGIRQISPGYDAIFKWESGITEDGESYDIVMEDITEVNHIALLKNGRGGSDVSILDKESVFMNDEEKKSLISDLVAGFKDFFKDKIITDAKPEVLTLDSLPEDPKDFTDSHIRFLLGMVRDSAMESSKSLDKPSEEGKEKPEEEAKDEKKEDSGLKEKASVEGEQQKEVVKDSMPIFNEKISTSKSEAFDLAEFDKKLFGKGGK